MTIHNIICPGLQAGTWEPIMALLDEEEETSKAYEQWLCARLLPTALPPRIFPHGGEPALCFGQGSLDGDVAAAAEIAPGPGPAAAEIVIVDWAPAATPQAITPYIAILPPPPWVQHFHELMEKAMDNLRAEYQADLAALDPYYPQPLPVSRELETKNTHNRL